MSVSLSTTTKDHKIRHNLFSVRVKRPNLLFLVPLVRLNHRSTEIKFSTHSYSLNDHDLTLVCPVFLACNIAVYWEKGSLFPSIKPLLFGQVS